MAVIVLRPGEIALAQLRQLVQGRDEVRLDPGARAAVEASRTHAKPVLSVSELVVSNPENPGPAALRELGRVCYPSAHRAVRALAAMMRWQEARDRRSRRG